MIPEDPQDMIEVAKQVELIAHERGWDKPTIVGVVVDKETHYEVITIPVHLGDLDESIRVALLRLAAVMHAARDILNREAPDEVRRMTAGIWLKYEAWSSPTPPEERGGRAAADMPDGRELRGVLVIDCGGRVVNIDRVRGEQPRVTFGEGMDVQGPMVGALAAVLLEHCYVMPDGLWDEAAIRKLAGLDA